MKGKTMQGKISMVIWSCLLAAIRVAGSWVVAVGMLMVGWLFRATG